MLMIRRAGALFTLMLVMVVSAAESDIFRWIAGDLALRVPAGWSVDETLAEDRLALAITNADQGAWLTLFPDDVNENALRGLLDAEITARGLLPLSYRADALWGRAALRAEVVSADRARVGFGVIGRLPDDRALLFVSDAEASTAALMLNSVSLSAAADPPPQQYGIAWSSTLNAEQGFIEIAADAARVYALGSGGVSSFDVSTGALITAFAFPAPAQPQAIAAHDGVIHVADTLCRCILRFDGRGAPLDPTGTFGAGAPLDVVIDANGVIFAVDRDADGYALQVISSGALNQRYPLQFNSAAPPYLALDGSGGVWVVEWLQSLLDGSITAAVARFDPLESKVELPLSFWIEGVPPENVHAVASDADGRLALITAAGVLIYDEAGVPFSGIEMSSGARAAAFTPNALVTLGSAGDRLTAYDPAGVPRRYGAPHVIYAYPVVGRLDDRAEQQTWTFSATAGDLLQIVAVDQSRTFPAMLGLDMALRLFAPDGGEIAYNDDHLALDLFGIYDAQIRDLTALQTGTYRVVVERVQGAGTYTLAVSAARDLELDTVTRVEGHIQDAIPFESWRFDGRAGDVFTFTMLALSGSLDPALELIAPDGSTIAYNDDALNGDLGTDAQIFAFILPADGMYTLEASRFSGAGRYELIIVRVN